VHLDNLKFLLDQFAAENRRLREQMNLATPLATRGRKNQRVDWGRPGSLRDKCCASHWKLSLELAGILTEALPSQAGALHAGQLAAPSLDCRVCSDTLDAAPVAPAMLIAAVNCANLSGVLTSSLTSDSFYVCASVSFESESQWCIYHGGTGRVFNAIHAHAVEHAEHRRLLVSVCRHRRWPGQPATVTRRLSAASRVGFAAAVPSLPSIGRQMSGVPSAIDLIRALAHPIILLVPPSQPSQAATVPLMSECYLQSPFYQVESGSIQFLR
jgi:hypothetical protein